MNIEIIKSAGAPAAVGPYSQAVKVGDLLFISGQIPLSPDGRSVTGGIEAETAQVLENLKSILQATGLSLDAVVQTTVYLTDLKDFAAFNQVYSRYFPSFPPARACVEVAALPRDARVEIAAVAVSAG